MSVAIVKALIFVIRDLIVIGNFVFVVILFVARIAAFVQFLVRYKLPGAPTQMAAAMHGRSVGGWWMKNNHNVRLGQLRHCVETDWAE